MTDLEFDLMDELYFVQPYAQLQTALGWGDLVLLQTLKLLYSQGYIKCLKTPDKEIFDEIDWQYQGRDLLYLATKKGLMAHNTI